MKYYVSDENYFLQPATTVEIEEPFETAPVSLVIIIIIHCVSEHYIWRMSHLIWCLGRAWLLHCSNDVVSTGKLVIWWFKFGDLCKIRQIAKLSS